LYGDITVFLEGGKLIIDETFTHLDSKDIIYITELINKSQLSLLNKIKAFYRAIRTYGILEDSDAIEKTVSSILEEF